MTLQGIAAINATGNGSDNVLTGNAAANLLDGAAGNDTLIGNTGNDTYVVDSADDMIKSYTRKYNRSRQASITQQINEIVTGANALQ